MVPLFAKPLMSFHHREFQWQIPSAREEKPMQMPESTEDTFWGKGFLATSLGTASPDRKKTHKGQCRKCVLWWRWFRNLEKGERRGAFSTFVGTLESTETNVRSIFRELLFSKMNSPPSASKPAKQNAFGALMSFANTLLLNIWFPYVLKMRNQQFLWMKYGRKNRQFRTSLWFVFTLCLSQNEFPPVLLVYCFIVIPRSQF